MTEKDAREAAKAEESHAGEVDARKRPENRTRSEDLGMGGAVVRFELVRGTGDAEVARLAELQHGHIHLHQLRAAGIGRNALAHRVATGRLHPTLPRVFLVGRPKRDLFGRMEATALYFKGDALVTGPASAQAWGLLDTTQRVGDRDPIDALLLGRNADPPPAVRVSRTASLAKQDIRWRSGIPVTSPALTILRLAGQMGDLDLETVLFQAFKKRLVSGNQLNDVMTRNPRAKGIATLRQLLQQKDGLRDTRSIYERKLLRLLKEAGFPRPLTNIEIDGIWVDCIWPDIKLVLEYDSWQHHNEREGFERDRLRDQRTLIAGHHTIRVTAHQIDRQPYALIARIATIRTRLLSETPPAQDQDAQPKAA